MAPLPNTGSKDGTNVYAAAYVSRAVAVLRRTASGALQQPADRSACINRDASMGCARARAIGAATAIAIDPDDAPYTSARSTRASRSSLDASAATLITTEGEGKDLAKGRRVTRLVASDRKPAASAGRPSRKSSALAPGCSGASRSARGATVLDESKRSRRRWGEQCRPA